MDVDKIDDVRFEIKRDENKGMNTDVVVYTTEVMLEKIKKDRTLQQAVNTSMLPGIIGKILLMPDAHEGYGFPVGGVAAFDSEKGIISPGAVGYDINCLVSDTRVYDENGSWRRISDFRGENSTVVTFDTINKNLVKAPVLLSMEKKCIGKILRIRTSLGREIRATHEHPILTSNGMVLAGCLKKGDKLVVTGFEGVERIEPLEKKIVSRAMLVETLDLLGLSDKGNAHAQILNFLHRQSLDEIGMRHAKLPVLIKLLGFVTGDGTIPCMKKGGWYATFYGKKEDLLKVKEDIEALGFGAAISGRLRHHRINTVYGTKEFDYYESSLHVGSAAFCVLMITLGAPFGNKSARAYRVPEWLMNSEDWQKRLFLAAYFGAEMSKPLTHNGYNFGCPSFSVSKLDGLRDNAVAFILDIKNMLNSLGIETGEPALVEGYRYVGKKGETVGTRLSVESNTSNLIKFFGTVGYLYNSEKERLGNLATLYLRYLEEIRAARNEVRQKAIDMFYEGIDRKTIISSLVTDCAGKSFVTHSLYGRSGNARVWSVVKFSDFVEKYEISKSGLVYDEIKTISELEYDGSVFDITVENDEHNFIANGIVVSNCGVRLIKTSLTEKEVRPKLNRLMDALFNNVPSGVGSKLKIGFSQSDLKRVAEEGVGYVISKGFGIENDLQHVEENGAMEGADFSKVSAEAKARGMEQLGTLGAGNHFLEIQKVEKIFDYDIAKAYGLYKDQAVVMVHCGSRGFGHQICSDYLRLLVEYQSRNNIRLPDPELSYARIGDKEANDYLAAMKCAVNYAFANREIITHFVRKSFGEVFGSDANEMDLLYDVAHNIAKLEEHVVDGRRVKVYVHRKGATRAFAKGRGEIPEIYRGIGQPVIIPGSMSTASYVLCGLEGAMKETFGTTCHGSGRVMSRHEALREIPASRTFETLKSKGIEIRARSRKLISEEAEWAYKNVDDVVGVVEKAGISKIVSRNTPIGVIKG